MEALPAPDPAEAGRLLAFYLRLEPPHVFRIEFCFLSDCELNFLERGDPDHPLKLRRLDITLALIFLGYVEWASAESDTQYVFGLHPDDQRDAKGLSEVFYNASDLHSLFSETKADKSERSIIDEIFPPNTGLSRSKNNKSGTVQLAINGKFLPPKCIRINILGDDRKWRTASEKDIQSLLFTMRNSRRKLPGAPEEATAQEDSSSKANGRDERVTRTRSPIPINELIPRALGIAPSPIMSSLGKRAKELSDGITIGDITLEKVPLSDHETVIRCENFAFNFSRPWTPPKHVIAAREKIRIKRRSEWKKDESEDNRQKIDVWPDINYPILDQQNRLTMQVLPSDYYMSLARLEAHQDIIALVARDGVASQIPFRLNVVAVLVSLFDNEFVWVKRTAKTELFPKEWSVLGEMFDGKRDIHDGNLDLASAVKAILREKDEGNIPEKRLPFSDVDVRFTAIATVWNHLLIDLYCLIYVPLSAKQIRSYLRLGGAEHPEFVTTLPFLIEPCVELVLKQDEYGMPGFPESRGRITNWGKAALIAALMSAYPGELEEYLEAKL